jgi:hypothetical protein
LADKRQKKNWMLEALLKEVRKNAAKEVAKLLTHPDQLQNVADYKQKTLKKKNTIEVPILLH